MVVSIAEASATAWSIAVPQKGHCWIEVLIVSLQVGHGKTATVPDRLRLGDMMLPLLCIGKGTGNVVAPQGAWSGPLD